jgi:hypothetical protein
LLQDVFVKCFVSVIFQNSGPKNGLGKLIGIFHDHGFFLIEQTFKIEGVLVVIFGELSKLKGDSFGEGIDEHFIAKKFFNYFLL